MILLVVGIGVVLDETIIHEAQNYTTEIVDSQDVAFMPILPRLKSDAEIEMGMNLSMPFKEGVKYARKKLNIFALSALMVGMRFFCVIQKLDEIALHDTWNTFMMSLDFFFALTK